jgi:hypothetical protein
MKKRTEQFKGIDTGLSDIENKPIHEGDTLIMWDKMPLTSPNHLPKTGRLRYQRGRVGYIIYNDGSFYFNISKRIGCRLMSSVVRHLGLKVIPSTDLKFIEPEYFKNGKLFDCTIIDALMAI